MTYELCEPYEDYPTVEDLQSLKAVFGVNYELVTDPRDILILLEMEGQEDHVSDAGCLFVVKGEGEWECVEIWGCENPVPYLDEYVWRIK